MDDKSPNMLTIMIIYLVAATALPLVCGADTAGLSDKVKSGSGFIGKTVCALESEGAIRGSYTPFAKNADFIEFGSVTTKDGGSYTVVVTRDGADKCAWHVRAALSIGVRPQDASGVSTLGGFVVSFNCAALETAYSSDLAYFGLIDPNVRLEYVQPRKAWVINVSSMKFTDIPTSKIYCPAFFGD